MQIKHHIQYFLLALFVTILFLIHWSIYKIFQWITTSGLVSITLIFSFYYFTMRGLVRIIAFPGVSKLFQRGMEYDYCKRMSTEVLRSVIDLKSCIEMFMTSSIQDADRTELLNLCKQFTQFQSYMYSMLKDKAQLEVQKESQMTIHADQIHFMQKLQILKRKLQETKIIYGSYEQTLWDFAGLQLSIQNHVDQLCASFAESEKRRTVNKLLESIADIEGELIQAVAKTTYQQSYNKFMHNKTFGTFEQMRVEMELRYKAQQVLLNSVDKTRIHGYYVPCIQAQQDDSNGNQEFDSSDEMTFQRKPNNYPTMIFCNPNAGFAEFFQYQSDWLDYYVHLGINVFVWNYRGFGLSEGSPSPKKLKEDSEIVAAYVRARNPHAKVGAHGLSMGGLIASHLARKGLVDFVFADRTFCNLESVPIYTMGGWAKWAIKLFTLWSSLDATDDFIYSNCYKVIAQDPNDEVINDNASLKTGVSLKIIQNELKNRQLEKTFGSKNDKKQQIIQRRKLVDIDNYYHILNKEETRILFIHLEEMFTRIFDLELHNKKLRKKIQKRLGSKGTNYSTNQSDISMKMDTQMGMISPKDLLTTTNDESLIKNATGQQQHLDIENSYLLTELDSVTSRTQSPNTSNLQTQSQFKPSRKRALKSQALKEKEEKIREAENDHQTDFIEYLEFLVDFYKQVERLDAAGRTIQSVFKDKKQYKFYSFRNWIINLDIWGSFYPLNIQCYDIQLTRTTAYVSNFPFFIFYRPKCMISGNKDYHSSSGNIMKKLLAQCEVIDYYFSKIESYLGRKHQNLLQRGTSSTCSDSIYSGSPKSTISDRQNTFDDEDRKQEFEEEGFGGAIKRFSSEEENKGDLRKVVPEEKGKKELTEKNLQDLEEDNVIFKDFTEPDLLKTGYLIPLNCGHNGQLSINEKTIYEIHLTNAGFIHESVPVNLDNQRSSENDS